MSSLYNRWRKSRDKGNLEYYSDEGFRFDYTDKEQQSKQRLAYNLIHTPIRDAIMPNHNSSYEILSLGCGPGSDMLAMMQVFQSVCTAVRNVRVQFTGVDNFRWPLKQFERQRSELEAQGPIGNFSVRFYRGCDMMDYVRMAINKGKQFDFIILSFAEVKTKIQFVTRKLPRMLYDGGRIFVIDNDIDPVMRLKNFGFKHTGSMCRSVCLVYGEQKTESYPSPDPPSPFYSYEL